MPEMPADLGLQLVQGGLPKCSADRQRGLEIAEGSVRKRRLGDLRLALLEACASRDSWRGARIQNLTLPPAGTIRTVELVSGRTS